MTQMLQLVCMNKLSRIMNHLTWSEPARPFACRGNALLSFVYFAFQVAGTSGVYHTSFYRGLHKQTLCSLSFRWKTKELYTLTFKKYLNLRKRNFFISRNSRKISIWLRMAQKEGLKTSSWGENWQRVQSAKLRNPVHEKSVWRKLSELWHLNV